MMVIGIDSHKDVLMGCLINNKTRPVEYRSVQNTPRGHLRGGLLGSQLRSWACRGGGIRELWAALGARFGGGRFQCGRGAAADDRPCPKRGSVPIPRTTRPMLC